MLEFEALQVKTISSCGHDLTVVGEIIGFAVEFKTCDLLILQCLICIHSIASSMYVTKSVSRKRGERETKFTT